LFDVSWKVSKMFDIVSPTFVNVAPEAIVTDSIPDVLKVSTRDVWSVTVAVEVDVAA